MTIPELIREIVNVSLSIGIAVVIADWLEICYRKRVK
jgi:hypothetical protein